MWLSYLMEKNMDQICLLPSHLSRNQVLSSVLNSIPTGPQFIVLCLSLKWDTSTCLIPFSNSLRGLIMILEVKQLWILKEKCPHHRQNYYLIYLKTEWMFSAKLKISRLLQEYNRSGHRLLSSCYTTLCESLCISSWNSQMTQENRLLLSLFYREAVGEKRNWVNFTWLTPSWASESHHLQTAGPELPAKAKWVFPLLSAKIPE